MKCLTWLLAAILGFLGSSVLALPLQTFAPKERAEAAAAFAQARSLDAWQYSVVPYIWVMGASGNSTARGQSVEVNSGVLDFESRSAFGLMAAGEMRKGPLSFYADGLRPFHLRKLSALGAVARAGSFRDRAERCGEIHARDSGAGCRV